MAVRPIRGFGDPVLRTPSEPVTSFDASLRQLVTDLLDTMVDAPGAGLAAPQIGVGLRVFAYNTDGHRGHLVNPELELSDEQQDGDEGCLSLPGLAFPTPRAATVMARGLDQRGRQVTLTASGFLARCLQHECDHLDGRLYVDRLGREARRQAMRAIRGLEWSGQSAWAARPLPRVGPRPSNARPGGGG